MPRQIPTWLLAINGDRIGPRADDRGFPSAGALWLWLPYSSRSPSDGLVEWTVQQVALATALSHWVAGVRTVACLALCFFCSFCGPGRAEPMPWLMGWTTTWSIIASYSSPVLDVPVVFSPCTPFGLLYARPTSRRHDVTPLPFHHFRTVTIPRVDEPSPSALDCRWSVYVIYSSYLFPEWDWDWSWNRNCSGLFPAKFQMRNIRPPRCSFGLSTRPAWQRDAGEGEDHLDGNTSLYAVHWYMYIQPIHIVGALQQARVPCQRDFPVPENGVRSPL